MSAYQSPETTSIVPCSLPLVFVVRRLVGQVLEDWGWSGARIADAGAEDFDAYPLSIEWLPMSKEYPYEFLIFRDLAAEREWELNSVTEENDAELLQVIIQEHQVTFVHPKANELGAQLVRAIQETRCFASVEDSAKKGGC